MTVILYDNGAYTLLAKHIYNKDNRGIWWFKRRVPAEVAKLYPNNKSGYIRFSLKTRDKAVAAKKADVEARQQDALWELHKTGELEHGPDEVKASVALLGSFGLKPGDARLYQAEGIEPDTFISELEYQAGVDPKKSAQEYTQRMKTELPPEYKLAAEMFYGEKVPVFLSDALKKFQDLKVQDPDSNGERGRVRVVNEFIALFGDQPVEHYTRVNANDYVRYLREEKKNKTTSVKRRTNSISAIFTLMISEGVLDKGNIFKDLQIKGYGQDSKERVPFTLEEIRTLQSLCLSKDDDRRWAIALMSDTGMRVAEAIGLKVKDVFLDAPVPYVHIRFDETRRVKGTASVRETPLVGASLWAARRAVEHSRNGFLFPRYIVFEKSPPTHKATHASNALNGWMKRQGISKTCHSFRHSMTDRLRNADVPSDMRDEIEGWKTKGQGAGYGSGYSLEKKAEAMKRIVLTDLFQAG